MGKHSRLTWEDKYFDGEIDPRSEIFCEESQTVMRRKVNDGWDEVGTWNDGNGYIDCLGVLHEKEYGDYGYTYDLELMSGKIKRLGELKE